MPVYDGCRTYRYGPVVITWWPAWISIWYWKNRPRVAMDQARSPIPAAMSTTPAITGHSRPPGHSTPPSRPSRSAAKTAAPMQPVSTSEVGSRRVSPPPARSRCRTLITPSNANQVSDTASNAIAAAPCAKISGSVIPPVHHFVATQAAGRAAWHRPGMDRHHSRVGGR